MIKKMVLETALGLGLAVFFVGRDLVSYVRTSAGYVTDAVKDTVPLQFQIDRARGMINDLVPEIRKNLHEIAREQVEVERMARRIAESEAALAGAEEGILRLTSDLKSDKEVFVYAGRTYRPEQVKADLQNRFERFKTNKATLDTQRQIYETRLRKLDARRQQLDGMLAQRQKLQVEVENLEARLKMLAAVQTASDYALDDSKLARAKELIQDLKTRLDVEERIADADGALHGEIPLEDPVAEDIVEQVTDYFSPTEAIEVALAESKGAND